MKDATLRTRALKATKDYTLSHWEIGAILAEIQTKLLFTQWDHETFAAYCETELGISRSKGNRLAGVSRTFGDYEASRQSSGSTIGTPFTVTSTAVVSSGRGRERRAARAA